MTVAVSNAFTITVTQPGSSTSLSTAAASLAVGSSIRFGTVPANVLVYGSETSDIIQWGDSMYYDATLREAGFIGKIPSPNPYHWVVYNETANSWSNTRAISWSTGSDYGHGYDHSTSDGNGTIYHRPYGSAVVRVYNGGSWSSLPAMPGSQEVVGGLAWTPSGLFYTDSGRLLRYFGGSWTTLRSADSSTWADMAEYNSSSNTLIFGGSGSAVRKCELGTLAISTIASPPLTIGINPESSVVCSIPNAPAVVAYSKSSGAFYRYNISTGVGSWTSSLGKCSGTGGAGLPNLTGNIAQSVVACPIPAYNVQMWVQFKGSSTPGDVWLYKYA